MIYLDQHAEPNDIARTLWRELGPQLCLEIAATIAVRSSRALVLEVIKEDANDT